MSSGILLKTQKNDLFNILEKVGLSHNDFEWCEVSSRHNNGIPVSTLIYIPVRKYYFNFDFYGDNHGGISRDLMFSPGNRMFEEREVVNTVSDMTQVFERWLSYLKREVEAPDYWAEVAKEREFVDTLNTDSRNNKKFSKKEEETIREKLAEIKKYLIEIHAKTDEQKEFINTRFDYLDKAIKRLGKFDWTQLFFSTIMGFVLKGGLESESVREILRYVRDNLVGVMVTVLKLSQ